MTTGPLASLLAQRRCLVLDGALGTELQRRGVDTRLPLWSARVLLDAPDVLLQIHNDHLDAGADIITANTWRTTARTFRRGGLPDRSAELTHQAISLARQARETHPGRTILVAGSMGPLEDCYRPDLVPSDNDLRTEHAEHAQRLASADVDILMLETFGSVREARIACEAALATGKEVIVSFLCRGDGRLYDGGSLEDAVATTADLPIAALSINCAPARSLGRLIGELRGHVDAIRTNGIRCLAAYGNVGREGAELDPEFVTTISPEEYGLLAAEWMDQGARIIGGCCGTTPAHVAAIRKAINTHRHALPGGGAA
jgi:S-methylmethionine-dependent homocysteine/selenocysteine methylase